MPEQPSDLTAAEALPRVSIVIPSYNGKVHLESLLASLHVLDYPRELLEIIIVDNGSSDGSVEYLESEHASFVTVIKNEKNLGFALPCNQGARAASGQYVAFLNNDMRVDRAWLRELLAPIFAARAAGDPTLVCTGSQILSWDGDFIDFIEGRVSIFGYGFQVEEGSHSILSADRTEPYEVPFACGGSLLLDRATFLDVGGFDEDFFALFEDVDLGYRLWAFGMRVMLAPKARTYHRMHSTVNAMSYVRRERVYTRNAFYFCYKNFENENMRDTILGSALLVLSLLTQRVIVTGVDPLLYETTGSEKIPVVTTDPSVAAQLFGVHDFVRSLPTFRKKRAAIQARRVRSDAELAAWPGGALFTHLPAPLMRDFYEIVQSFIDPDRYMNVPRRIALVFADVVPLPGIATSGFGMRIWGIGKGLESRGHTVIWMIYDEVLEHMEKLATEPIPPEWKERVWNGETIGEALDHAYPELIVACGWPTANLLPDDLRAPLVVDQAGPHLLERQFQQPEKAESDAEEKIAALRRADFFVSSGVVQQEYFDDWLARADFPCDETGAIDPCMKAVIPFSVSPDLPPHPPRGDRPLTFTYSGYFLPWKDPSVALTTVATWAMEHDAKVRIFGGSPPFHTVPPGVMDDLIRELEAMPSVEFRGVLPADALIAEYRHVDVAIDLMQRNRERELAFTTTTVVYLWAGIPVIYNNYSELSGYIAEYDAGWTLDPEDTDGLHAVLAEIARNPAVVARKSANAQRLVRDHFTWDRTIEPLDAFCRRPFVRQQSNYSRGPDQDEEEEKGWTPPKADEVWILLPYPAVYSSLVTRSRDTDPALTHIARSRRTATAQAIATTRAALNRLLRREQHIATYHDMLARVGPLLTGTAVVTQRFVAEQSTLQAVDVRFATYGRTNTPDLTVTLATETGDVEQTVTISVASFVDGEYVRFEFDAPFRNQKDKTLILTLASPDGILGDSVAPWLRVSASPIGEPARVGNRVLPHPLDLRPVFIPD